MRAARTICGRVFELIVVFFAVTFMIYAMVWALPGDPVASLSGDRPPPPNVIAQIRAKYNLDKSLPQQYFLYLGGLFTGDLGTTFSGRSVSDRMSSRWPVTITLALTAWVIQVVIGITLGMIAGLRSGGLLDRTVLIITVVATSIPIFVVAVSSQLIFGLRLGWLPIAGTDAGWPISYLTPACVVALFGLAAIARLMRGSVIDTMQSDFVRTLRAKGIPHRRIVGVHVTRNSVGPVLTFVAIDLGFLLGGAVVVEGIFNLPGIGQLLFSAIRTREGPTVVGVGTLLILIFLVLNLLVDLVNAMLDPRIRRD